MRHETSLSPPVKYFDLRFQGGTSFVDRLCYLCLVFVMLSRLIIAALWSHEGKKADLWVLVCDIYCDFVIFPFGILGQVWYLIVLIPDSSCLSYFHVVSVRQ